MSESGAGTARTSRARAVTLLGDKIEQFVALAAAGEAVDAAERASRAAEEAVTARREEFAALYRECVAHGWTPEQLEQGGCGPERGGRTLASPRRRAANGRRSATTVSPGAGAPPAHDRRGDGAPAPTTTAPMEGVPS